MVPGSLGSRVSQPEIQQRSASHGTLRGLAAAKPSAVDLRVDFVAIF